MTYPDLPTWLEERFETVAFDQALELVAAQQELEEACLRHGFISGTLVA